MPVRHITKASQQSSDSSNKTSGKTKSNKLQGREVEKVERTSACDTAWKVTKTVLKTSFILSSSALLLYWAICDLEQEGFCVFRNSTEMDENLEFINHLFD